MANILLVEDDPNFGAVLRDYLQLHDHQAHLARNGVQGLRVFHESSFDACILDVMMPEKDGFTLAREIREVNLGIPLIFLTARSMKADMLEGFRLGADDYITKPFDSEILLCKLKAILKRKQQPSRNLGFTASEFRIGPYTFHSATRLISLGAATQKLSPKEAELLLMLCARLNGVLVREEALVQIWGADNYFTGRSMDVFITKLRKYLKDDPEVKLLNVHGHGYRLIAPAMEEEVR